jgi:predicted nucleic acid-binding protein
MPGVSNSSPLIYLAALGDLHLLPTLFGRVFIPRAVHREVVVEGIGKAGTLEVETAVGQWLSVEGIQDTEAAHLLAESSGLQFGESEAIILAQERNHRIVFLDDQGAVVIARSRGLEVVRTPAHYVIAKNLGLVKQVGPKIDALRQQGFHLRDRDYLAALARAGESPC